MRFETLAIHAGQRPHRAFRLRGRAVDFLLGRRDWNALLVAMAWEECQPAYRHFPIRPFGDNVGTSAQDAVVVSGQNSVGADFNGENGRKGCSRINVGLSNRRECHILSP